MVVHCTGTKARPPKRRHHPGRRTALALAAQRIPKDAPGVRAPAPRPARTPRPDPQSQSFSRSYGSVLPTSLTYILLSTRGCTPWRPDAVMSTPGGANKVSRSDFQGPSAAHRTGEKFACFPSAITLSPANPIPGCRAVNKKRELFSGLLQASPNSFVLPHAIHVPAQEY